MVRCLSLLLCWNVLFVCRCVVGDVFEEYSLLVGVCGVLCVFVFLCRLKSPAIQTHFHCGTL